MDHFDSLKWCNSPPKYPAKSSGFNIYELDPETLEQISYHSAFWQKTVVVA